MPIKYQFWRNIYFIKYIKGIKCTKGLFTCFNLVLIIDYLYIYAYVDRKYLDYGSNVHALTN